MSATSESPPANLSDGEPPASCPPSLVWQDVIREVQQSAEHWTVDRPGGVLQGLTLGQGSPLVFLNGLAERVELHFLLAWLLRDQFRCVLFDWRGIRSADRAPRLTLETLVDDLLDVVGHWPAEPNDLVAFGLGGLVALRALSTHPRVFRSLIVCNGYARRRLTLAERALITLGQLPGIRRASVPALRATLEHSHRRWFPPFDATRFDFLVELVSLVSPGSMARLAGILRQTDLRAELPGIQQPVLILNTEGQGRILREAAGELARALPAARVEELNNTGQLPGLTHPHRVAKVIRGFLAEPASETAASGHHSNRSSP